MSRLLSKLVSGGSLVLVLASLLIWTGSVSTALGQKKQSQVAIKYWVFFKDKPTAPGKKAIDISEAAVIRRDKRGSRKPAALDVPVSAGYLSALSERGIHLLNQSRWLNAVSVVMTPEERDAVRELHFVRDVRPVGVTRANHPQQTAVELTKTSTSTIFSNDDNNLSARRIDYGPSLAQLQLMNAIDPIERGFIGSGIVLGFIDTEFDTLNHAVFSNLKADNRLLGAQFFTPGPQSNRHGVSVASVAVGFAEGQLIGPAYDASVLLATTEYAPTETNQEEDAFVAGMEWLESQGADVVNTSLGYTQFDSGQHSYVYADLDGDTGITTIIADIAASLGVVVVTSAGNDGTASWYYIGTPADADSVISVGATNSGGVKASFSSFGPTADGRIKPEVSAMGQGTYVASGNGGYGASNGTSFSSPLVAAVACQILQANPDLTPMQVRQVLMDTASQNDSPDNQLGYGVVNAGAAVDLAISMIDLGIELGTDDQDVNRLSIAPPYPNPASDFARIIVSAQDRQVVWIDIYDLSGRRIISLPKTWVDSGENTIIVSTSELPSGIYTIRIASAESSAHKRLAVIK